jgi:hypothetical protein
MYFEVFLEIFVAFFAFFGLLCLVKLIGVVWFGYDNVRVTIEIDSYDSAKNIEEYIKEAQTSGFFWGGNEIAVLVRSKYYDEELAQRLERKRVKYFVIE